MNRRIVSKLILLLSIVVILAITANNHRKQLLNVNARVLLTKALLKQESGSYITSITTTALHSGKATKTQATIFHNGSDEKIEYTSREHNRIWALTRGSTQYTFIPKENKLLVSKGKSAISDTERIDLILKNYLPEVQNIETISGRSAYLVNMVPRYSDRPWKKLWIDKEHFTILRSIDYSAAGDERARMDTSKIVYGVKLDPERFTLPTDPSIKTLPLSETKSTSEQNEFVPFAVTKPEYIPKGYVLDNYIGLNCRCNCNHKAVQLTYTDGLNIISIFETPLNSCGSGMCGASKNGCGKGCMIQDCAMAKMGTVSRNDKTIVVVADLLPKEIKLIANSVR